MPKRFVVVCLVNFFITALMGLVLRYSFIEAIPFNYRFLTHAHSHVAMLGWGYLMLFVFIVHYFIPKRKHAHFKRLFWITQIAVVGMILSFPFQGYAAISITFSTLHILCSYYFVYLVWKQVNITSKTVRRLIKAALVFMLISTLGVWCLGPAVATLGQASAFYQIAIQFFLHFQFNGWFLIAVIAIFFYFINIQESRLFRVFFRLLVISTILSFALPVQWFAPHKILFWINGLAMFMQLVVLIMFLRLIKFKLTLVLQHKNKLLLYLYSFAIFCFVLKMGLQLASVFPEFSQTVYQHRNFVIGFIHLIMLGIVSGFLLAFILKSGWLQNSKVLNVGVACFLFGFVLTEALLLLQGYRFFIREGLFSYYYTLLFAFSILLPLGIGLLLVNNINCLKAK
ncbi:hypothetical protein [Aestuariivivens insulae]|uniref:hypothetical protein n=1 Tax=Aestuariivivens insulae TaxID=1621988 RepID=UPI001F587928|nr:hypothetical protein [Aestuariivivens insulae]